MAGLVGIRISPEKQTGEAQVPVTYYVIVLFDRDAEGDLTPGEGREVQSANAAISSARTAVIGHSGAVAFSRTGDPATGEFEDAVVLAQFGEVDLDALSG